MVLRWETRRREMQGQAEDSRAMGESGRQIRKTTGREGGRGWGWGNGRRRRCWRHLVLGLPVPHTFSLCGPHSPERWESRDPGRGLGRGIRAELVPPTRALQRGWGTERYRDPERGGQGPRRRERETGTREGAYRDPETAGETE